MECSKSVWNCRHFKRGQSKLGKDFQIAFFFHIVSRGRFYHSESLKKILKKVLKKVLKLDPVGSTVRYEMMKLCSGPV